MPAATQPTLNSASIPYPKAEDGYVEESFLKGSVRRMANGALVRDLVTTDVKLRFTFNYSHITVTERGQVETALGYLKDGTSRAFLSPRNVSYTVVLAEGGEPEWEVRPVQGGAAFRYSGTLKLEEV